MKFEVGKSYRTRCGDKSTIMAVDLKHPVYTIAARCSNDNDVEGVDVYTTSGKYTQIASVSPYDLVAEWTEPVKGEGWAVVFDDGLPQLRNDREEAVSAAAFYRRLSPPRIVKIRYEEVIE